jgi:hypothetical protein
MVMGGLCLLLGCAYGRYGRTRIAAVPQEDIEAFMEREFDTFHVSYSGERERPGAIQMDLKGDSVSLTGEGWHPIADKGALRERVGNMRKVYRRYRGVVGAVGPRLYVIEDSEGNRIGYLFTALSHTPVRPDGDDYSLDPVHELDVRNQAYPRGDPSDGGKRGKR